LEKTNKKETIQKRIWLRKLENMITERKLRWL